MTNYTDSKDILIEKRKKLWKWGNSDIWDKLHTSKTLQKKAIYAGIRARWSRFGKKTPNKQTKATTKSFKINNPPHHWKNKWWCNLTSQQWYMAASHGLLLSNWQTKNCLKNNGKENADSTVQPMMPHSVKASQRVSSFRCRYREAIASWSWASSCPLGCKSWRSTTRSRRRNLIWSEMFWMLASVWTYKQTDFFQTGYLFVCWLLKVPATC